MKKAPISRVRASVVCVHQDKLLAVRMTDPVSRRECVFLPGGEIEADETAPEAAERETREETGFRVAVDPASGVDREYDFEWKNEVYDCLTIFYWGRLASPIQGPVEDNPVHGGVVWVPLADIAPSFAYSADILDAIQELLRASL